MRSNYAPARQKPVVKLDRWARVGESLLGYVTGHPRFEDGCRVQTGKVVEFLCDEDGSTAETKNTVYQLGREA